MMNDKSQSTLATMTDAVIEAMKNGCAPWQMPWDQRDHAAPQNLSTGKAYNGLNAIFLRIRGGFFGCNHWVGYGQAQELGGHVRKGEKGTQILSPRFKKELNPKTGKEEQKLIGFLVVTVFNVKQCEGLTLPELPEPRKLDANMLDAFAANTGASICETGNQACYIPALDVIQMPPRDTFHSEAGYYGTLLHELTHWTGHKSRLDRLDVKNKRGYAFEELIAELGAWLASEELGCPNEAENHVSYLAGWMKALESDPRYLLDAASRAEKAARYLIELGREEEAEEAA